MIQLPGLADMMTFSTFMVHQHERTEKVAGEGSHGQQ
jgi:hypothetical protein